MPEWIQTDKPLPDGWYWRKCHLVEDTDPNVIEVINGIIVDSRPIDSYGANWEVYEHDEFKGWWWWGPLNIPPHKAKYGQGSG